MRGDSEERLRELTERVWLLEQELAALRRDLGRGAPPVAPPEGRPGWPATGLTVAPAAPPATWPAPPEQRPVPPGPPPGWAPPPSAPGAPEAGWPPAAPPAAVTAPAPAALSGPSAASAAPAPAAWPGEWLARLGGGNWLARVGVLVLGLGVVYFLQLAFSNDWIPLWARAALGVGGGLALAVAGEVLRRRGHDTTYAQILAGGGASIAYVTVYAAYALPHYRAALHLTLPVEILLLAAVSAALATYAYRRDLPVLATVAVVQAALLVAPAGDFSEAGIAVFLLLGSGVFAASHRPGWQVPMLSAAVAGAASHVAAAFHPDVDARATAVGIAVLSVLGVAAARRDGSGRGEARFVALMLPLATAFVWWHVSGAVWHGSPAWALLAAAALSLAAALAGRRVAGPLALAGAVLLLVWPRAAFPASLGQPSAYAALAALAAGLAAASVAARASATRGGLPASLQRARGGRWPVRAHVAEAAAAAYLVAATLSLFLVAAPRGLAQQHPWWAGLLALAVA
ncbi:MAG TPA: DUF2339 domain-containing protein, partial [Candidatus Thermoplasmatota archaeon]|nr:DUF2339 domain-containing protein [Candidatus Thermoplasmatota archaeon]